MRKAHTKWDRTEHGRFTTTPYLSTREEELYKGGGKDYWLVGTVQRSTKFPVPTLSLIPHTHTSTCQFSFWSPGVPPISWILCYACQGCGACSKWVVSRGHPTLCAFLILSTPNAQREYWCEVFCNNVPEYWILRRALCATCQKYGRAQYTSYQVYLIEDTPQWTNQKCVTYT